MIRIAVDGMGGDYAPQVVVIGFADPGLVHAPRLRAFVAKAPSACFIAILDERSEELLV